jgi:hypothetical protein
MTREELKEFLVYDLSSEWIESLIASKSDKSELVEMLYSLSWTNEQPASWRSAWVLEHLAHDNKELIRHYLKEIPKKLYNAESDGQKRHYLKMLLLFPVTEVDMGRLLDLSFRWLESPSESIAVRAQCMNAIEKIMKYEPDIKEEFVAMLSLFTNDESAGLKNKSRKLLQKYQK